MPIYAFDGIAPELPDGGDCWVAPDANLIGKVRLGEGANVWFGATLRGDNEWISLGTGTNVQEGVVGHTDPGFEMTLGDHVTVGHGAIIHGCTIGDGSLIGMGATILNGATIGAGCLVGAGALVTEGKSFPDGSLIVGAPARVVRALSAEEQEKLRATALRYVARGRAFADGLTEVG